MEGPKQLRRVRLVCAARPDDPDPRTGEGYVERTADWVGPIPRPGDYAYHDQGYDYENYPYPEEHPARVVTVLWDHDGLPTIVFESWLNRMARGVYERRNWTYHSDEWRELPPLSMEEVSRRRAEFRRSFGWWGSRPKVYKRRNDALNRKLDELASEEEGA